MLDRLMAHLKRNAYGIVAIFIALGGTAYAAATIGAKDIKSSAVRAKHIKDNAVRSKHIKDSQVATSEVANDSLIGEDIDESTLEGVNARRFDGAILISDQDSAGAGQGGPKTIGEIPGVGHFEASCTPNSTFVQFVSEFNGGSLGVWQDYGPDDALYEEVPNGGSTSPQGTAAADIQGKLVTYRIHRAQQSAPEVRAPKATITVSLRRGTPTIPDLCNYTVQGIAEP